MVVVHEWNKKVIRWNSLSMRKEQFKYLIGKHKEAIISEFGQDFNYYPSERWAYELGKKNWLGKRKVLIILFEDSIVKSVNIRNCYGNFSFDQL